VCSPATNTCERPSTGADASLDGATDASTDGAIDASIDASPDGSTAPVTVARYLFDDNVEDETGAHDATIVGTGLTYPNGRNGSTDHAVAIPTTLAAHVRIPDSPAFDIASGTIDVWFRYDSTAPDGDLGLVSRDANGSATNGHFNLRLGHDRRVVMRIQQISDPTVEAYRCTAALVQPNVWHHVAIGFGGTLSMEVDGVAATGASWSDASSVPHDCTAAWAGGIDGNDNPWVVGALTIQATDGTGMPVASVAGGVQIDELVIRRNP
jgi:hypothetical protein